jgi:Fe2+ transport system protein FeoA
MNPHIFPLAFSSAGENVRLEKIHGGGKISRHLTALGLTPGVNLHIIQNSGGPLLISVRNSRIALGRGMAQKLLVSAINGNSYNESTEKHL